jgi:hypothetical protein
LVLTAGSDATNLKENGDLIKILKSKEFGSAVKTVDFPEMAHGWVSRGDITDPVVARDLKIAIDMTLEFF